MDTISLARATTGPSWAGALTTVSTLPCTSYMWAGDFEEVAECRIPFFSYQNFFGPTSSRKFFAPGLCFSGWTVGCDFPTKDPSLPSSVTRKLCVPSGFGCCPFSNFNTIACNTTAVPSPLYTRQPAFEIRWASADLSKLQTHPMTPGLVLAAFTSSSAPFPPTGSTTSLPSLSLSSTTVSSSTEQSNNTEASNETGIPNAAKTGIGVGIAIFVLLVAALLLLFIRRQRSKRLNRSGAVAPQPNIHPMVQELRSHERKAGEHPDKSTTELASREHQVAKIMLPEPVCEMDGEFQGLRPPPSPGRILQT